MMKDAHKLVPYKVHLTSRKEFLLGLKRTFTSLFGRVRPQGREIGLRSSLKSILSGLSMPCISKSWSTV